MSLILEALRKSEAERRRGQAPDVAVELSPPQASGRVDVRRWLWPVLAAVTLFALVPVLAIWWIARDSWVPDDAPAASPAAASDPPAIATDVTREVAPAVVARAPARLPVTVPPPDAAATADRPPEPVAPATPSLPAPPSPDPDQAAMPGPAAPAAVGMSGVRLSMHLWNEDPARRFVVLNGQRMMEGDRSGNVTLVEILRDGVLVERDGLRARVDLP